MMLPDHKEITEVEMFLEDMAVPFGGENDGWGCFVGHVIIREGSASFLNPPSYTHKSHKIYYGTYSYWVIAQNA
jgi:hypothetical protein